MIIGFVGLIGSGKDTAADYLVNFHGFRRESFASTLKDAVAAVFGWDRILLEGRTKQAREWREQVDAWWANRLGIPQLTPRWVLQNWGTEVFRKGFHNDIWIASLENKMRKTQDDIVISDVRFPNEIDAIHSLNGLVTRIKRGPDPEWFDLAYKANLGDITAQQKLSESNVHSSETSWIGGKIDQTITNDSSIDDLYLQIQEMTTNLESNLLVSKANVAYEVAVGNWHRLT